MDKNRKTNSWKTGRATLCPIRQPVALTYAPALNVLNLKYLISTDFRVRIRSRESYRGETWIAIALQRRKRHPSSSLSRRTLRHSNPPPSRSHREGERSVYRFRGDEMAQDLNWSDGSRVERESRGSMFMNENRVVQASLNRSVGWNLRS